MKCRLSGLFLIVCLRSFPQAQTCPVNINYATGDLTHWFAYTGNNKDGNGDGAIKQKYDSLNSAPAGTRGAKSILEYGLNSVLGIRVITYQSSDPFGGFQTLPTINGYTYNYSILLGSTAITRGNGANNTGGGGYIRGVSYQFTVPPGPAAEPYTMTYAYAMVLENGTHVSSQQPLISATLRTPAGVIQCASPSYFLPTFGNVSDGGRGATLDSATAKANGFRVSGLHSPNANPDPNAPGPEYLQDVWTKNWTEVTFDLSPYRGQKVSLTFEADNCEPGGHFAYGYIAIRNSCAGLEISGDSLVCNNTNLTYSVPSLANASYSWNIPDSWSVISGDNTNIIKVRSSSAGGSVSVREKNSCADLSDTVQIKTLPSPVGGILDGSTAVCEGENSSILSLVNYSGNIVHWLGSADSVNWSVIPNTQAQFTATGLDQTTYYKVVVGKGNVCPPDSSSPATIAVDLKSVGGLLNPPLSALCAGQTAGQVLILSGNLGSIKKWQYSAVGNNWLDLSFPNNSPLSYTVTGITSTTLYRAIDQNGVCPADTSAIASIQFDPVSFPAAVITPADTTICYGTAAALQASVLVGTSYTWDPLSSGSGNLSPLPFNLVNKVTPDSSSDYVLIVLNNGCPNALLDTFHISVLPKVIVFAGNDTSVVVGEPLQFQATSSDAGPDSFTWFPETELSDPNIYNPQATYTANDHVIRYTVKATTPAGCSGEGNITVKVFKTKPDIFVPNAFTPGLSVNSLFRPIPVGITSLDYFRIYNRLGQLVYNTSSIGSGWDGNLDGKPQAVGGYVWMVKGTDYTGNVITKKGTMVLIR